MSSIVEELSRAYQRATRLAEQRADALEKFMAQNDCTTTEQLNQLVANHSLKREYKIKDPSVLKWSLEELRDRLAVPVGTRGFNANDQHPSLPPLPEKRFLYVIPPSINDPNVYSIHCHLPPGDIFVDMAGVKKVSYLCNLNWIIGMNNGVSGFGLGPSDDRDGWHTYAYDLYKQMHAALKTPKFLNF